MSLEEEIDLRYRRYERKMDGSYGCYIGSPRKIGKVDTYQVHFHCRYTNKSQKVPSQNFPEDRPLSRTDSVHERFNFTVPLEQTGYIFNVVGIIASNSKDVWPSG